jgi:predicted ABC-type ATPase
MIPSKYLISPELHEDIFTKLKSDVFSELQPVEMPIAVIVGGQPGAGKTNINTSLKALYNKNIAMINGDDYREMHPYFPLIAEENDKNIVEYTEPDVRDWTSRLFNFAINNSYNAALEITLRQDKPILAALEN